MLPESNIGEMEDDDVPAKEDQLEPSNYMQFQFNICWCKNILVQFDRLDLQYCLDKSIHWVDVIITPLLAAACAWTGIPNKR